jgi:serine/threonine protein kinase
VKFNPIIDSAQKLFRKSSEEAPRSPDTAGMNESTVIMSEETVFEKITEIPLPEAVDRKYLIQRTIGRGAFGTVYLAEDKKIGRFVAIKQLVKSISKKKGRETYERFMQEARIGAQLNHPNIINVFALEEDEKSACIIMEYLPGGSLAAVIKNSAKFRISDSIRIFSGILDGLQAAHEVMIIHRDIKPQNILFDAKDDPKITDFGVALLPAAFGGLPDKIQNPEGAIIGTPLYMSPEQISHGKVDARADLYSAGAVMYELLNKNKIFNIERGHNFEEFRQAVLFKKPEPISEVNAPPDLSRFIMKLLEKDPKKRFQSARDALAALKTIDVKSEESEAKGQIISHNISSPSAMLEDVIRLFLIDGNISPAERRELERRSERLGFTKGQSRTIEEKVRADLNISSLKEIEEYEHAMENFLEQNETLSLDSSQIIRLETLREKNRIREDDAKSILRYLIDKIKYKRLTEKNKIIL